MAFCSLSGTAALSGATLVPNKFIEEYLPLANGELVKVFLYGLMVCGNAERYDNTLLHFANNLQMGEQDVLTAFEFWKNKGLVQIIDAESVQIKYLPVKPNINIKKYNTSKFDEFNAGIQAIIDGRQILPTEFTEYYALMEAFHIEPEALVAVAKYCADSKGRNIGGAYIIQVAKNWAYDGVRTLAAVREKLSKADEKKSQVIEILNALKSKRTPEPEDFDLLSKWALKLGFEFETILMVAKKQKSSDINRLDETLLKYFELKLFDAESIKEYEKNKSKLFELARAVNKKIGVYYEDTSNIIEGYLMPWRALGLDDDAILAFADFSFKTGVRTLEKLNEVIRKHAEEGVITPEALDESINERVSENIEIKKLLEKLGALREPTSTDISFYKNWQKWNFTPELFDYAVSLSIGKDRPMAYLNKILASYYTKKIATVEGAKNQGAIKPQVKKQEFIRHNYDDETVAKIYARMNNVEF
ncbi:MAG: DnaD domain protein [Christensenellaceae bacterium]|jgi:hypothetical protein|nr:DnaD domain protein [Christensenellaceae bacterium]